MLMAVFEKEKNDVYFFGDDSKLLFDLYQLKNAIVNEQSDLKKCELNCIDTICHQVNLKNAENVEKINAIKAENKFLFTNRYACREVKRLKDEMINLEAEFEYFLDKRQSAICKEEDKELINKNIKEVLDECRFNLKSQDEGCDYYSCNDPISTVSVNVGKQLEKTINRIEENKYNIKVSYGLAESKINLVKQTNETIKDNFDEKEM